MRDPLIWIGICFLLSPFSFHPPPMRNKLGPWGLMKRHAQLIYDVACDPQPAPPHLLFQHSCTITTPSSPWFSLLFCFLIGWTKSNTKATTILTKASFSFVDNIEIRGLRRCRFRAETWQMTTGANSLDVVFQTDSNFIDESTQKFRNNNN